MSKVAVIAKLTATPGKRDELIDAIGSMMDAVQSEEGTDVYALHRDAGDDDAVWFYELYRDHDVLGTHSSSGAMAAFGASLGGLVAAAPEITLLDPVAAKGLSLP